MNVVFRFDVDAGAKYGTGHFQRTIKIFKELKKKKNLKFFALYKSNSLSVKVVPKFFKNQIIFNNVFKQKLTFLNKNDILISDTPGGLEKKLFLFCKNKGVKLVSFDEINKRSVKYNLLINSVIFLKRKLKRSKNIFQGFKYFIADKKFQKENKKAFINKNLRICVCPGGTDNKKFLIKVYNILKTIKNIKVNFFASYGIKKNNRIFKIKRNYNFKILQNKKNLKYFFDRSHVNIVSGGFTMIESVITKTPTLVIKTYSHQNNTIRELKKLKLINYLGNINTFNKTRLINCLKKISSIKRDNYFIKKKIKNNIIDANGLDRVISLIIKLTKSKKF